MISDKQLDEWETVAANATDGPWHVGHISEQDDSADIECPQNTLIANAHGQHNEAFICAARTALPLLVAEVRRLKKDLGPTGRKP